MESVIERAIIASQGNILQVVDRRDNTLRKIAVPAGNNVKALAEMEQQHILRTLQNRGWRIEGNDGTALLLGHNPNTLRARMRTYGIVRRP